MHIMNNKVAWLSGLGAGYGTILFRGMGSKSIAAIHTIEVMSCGPTDKTAFMNFEFIN
jgi:hypothetical protein